MPVSLVDCFVYVQEQELPTFYQRKNFKCRKFIYQTRPPTDTQYQGLHWLEYESMFCLRGRFFAFFTWKMGFQHMQTWFFCEKMGPNSSD
jgi:hypothetical protein